MFKQFIQNVPGADWFMIGSLAVFGLFFIGVTVYLLTVDRKKMDEMAQLPLQSSSTDFDN